VAQALHQLAHIRRARGYSQAQLGQAAGLGQRYISDLEHGQYPADPNHVLRLAAVLGVEPAALSAQQLTICTSPSGVIAVNHV
jgi:transcriptional regulator with XRE-family HTH domain